MAGFETTDRRDFYDLAIGNVPFGQYSGERQSLQQTGFQHSQTTFRKIVGPGAAGRRGGFRHQPLYDGRQGFHRAPVSGQRAELLGAIRLPNNAFKANAGTEVVSDILFLQKRDRPLDIYPDWTQTGRTEEGFTVNQYFLDHPEMVLGQPTAESTKYGKQDYTVVPIEGLELADQLHDAVQQSTATYQEAALPELARARHRRFPTGSTRM